MFKSSIELNKSNSWVLITTFYVLIKTHSRFSYVLPFVSYHTHDCTMHYDWFDDLYDSLMKRFCEFVENTLPHIRKNSKLTNLSI